MPRRKPHSYWKTAQRHLYEHEGLEAADRNLVVHVYREAVERDLDSRLAAHASTLTAWVAAMRSSA